MFIMTMVSNFLFNFTNFCVIVSFFLTKLLTLHILFSTAIKALVVTKLVIHGISLLTSFISALRVVLVVKLVMSGILSSIFLILALYTPFLTASFFTTLLSLLKQKEQVLIYQHLIYLFYFLNCLNHQEQSLICLYLFYQLQLLK